MGHCMSVSRNEKCLGHHLCDRGIYSDGFCALHLPEDHIKALSCDDYDALLVKEIEEAEKGDNGIYTIRWHGLNFPKNHVLFGFRNFETVKDRLADCWINIEESNIQQILIGPYDIHNLILSRATIHGDTSIGVTRIDYIGIEKANFLGKFHCAAKTKTIMARDAIFNDEFTFGSTIYGLANFNGSRFHNSCHFYGVDGLLFGDKADNNFKVAGFDHVIFEKPIQTLFRDVDLHKASFKAVSLVGVRFNNTDFYQQELNRNGIYNEVKELQRRVETKRWWFSGKKADKHSIKRNRDLIHEYRQLRMAMENNKDYVKAHEFYIGEMEARQRHHWSFILALYRFSSYCGTNYVRAFKVLFSLFVLHFVLTIISSTNLQVQKLFSEPDLVAAWGRLGDIVIHSLSTGTLQRIGLLKDLSGWQNLIDLFFRVFIPIQTAMFVLALRNKTKR